MKRLLLSLLGTWIALMSAFAQPGSLDLSFDPLVGFNGTVLDAVVQPDGKIICVGEFTSYRGVARSCIARLNPDASLDLTFNVGAGFTQANQNYSLGLGVVRLLASGKILCGGGFSHYNGVARTGVVRLEANGVLDNGFALPFTASAMHDMEVTSAGGIYLFGAFTAGPGAARTNIARVFGDGSLDTAFDPGTGLTGGAFLSGALELSRDAGGLEDGGIIYGGQVLNYNGLAVGRLMRALADGTRDVGFNTPAQAINNDVYGVVYDKSTNKYYVTGAFTSFGSAAGRIVRIGLDGQRDASFTAAFNGTVGRCLTSPANAAHVYVSGPFTAYTTGGNTTCNGIARVNASGAFDASFVAGAGFSASSVYVVPGPSGTLYAFGGFTAYNGTTRNRICRIQGLAAGTTGTLEVTTGANGQQTTWRLYDDATAIDVANGGGYASNTTTTVNVPLPSTGTLRLRFNDSGNDGLPGGGWVLRNASAERLIDNTNNGGCFAAQSIARSFTMPQGSVQVVASHRDIQDWNYSSFIQCNTDAAVTAQWGVGTQTDDGYEFQFFSPCNSGSWTHFRTHAAAAGMTPANASRASKMPLSLPNCPLKAGEFLNVRVRPVVNGVYGDWGPVCRFMLTAVPHNTCTTTQLTPSTCGNSYTVNNTDQLQAIPAWVTVPPVFPQICDQVGQANKYAFKFQIGSFIRYQYSNTANLTMLTSVPSNQRLRCGTYTYNVSVAVSFNGGANYCAFGPSCPVTITASSPNCTLSSSMVLNEGSLASFSDEIRMTMDVWPNPLSGQSLNVRIDGFAGNGSTVEVNVIDAVGRVLLQQQSAYVEGGTLTLNEVLDLPKGLYLLRVQVGDEQAVRPFVVE